MLDVDSRSDEELMSLTAGGDQIAFEALYDRYASKAMGFMYKIVQDQGVSAELVQELFIRLWDNRTSFDASRAKFTTWMFGIARNMAIDSYRRAKRRPVLAQSESQERKLEQKPDSQQNVLENVSLRWRQEQLQEAVQVLPDDQRLVIEYAYFKGMTRQEISEELDVPLGTVHSRARLALKKLGRALDDLRIENE